MKKRIENTIKKLWQSEQRELFFARWAWPLGLCALGLGVGAICLSVPVADSIRIPGAIAVCVFYGSMAGLVSAGIDRRLARPPR